MDCEAWYQMKIGEAKPIKSNDSVLRVPGGWVVSTPTGAVFVPHVNSEIVIHQIGDSGVALDT